LISILKVTVKKVIWYITYRFEFAYMLFL